MTTPTKREYPAAPKWIFDIAQKAGMSPSQVLGALYAYADPLLDANAALQAEIGFLKNHLALAEEAGKTISKHFASRGELVEELRATIERQRGVMQQAKDSLVEWDGLINYQFTGSREAMSALTDATNNGYAALTALQAELKEKP